MNVNEPCCPTPKSTLMNALGRLTEKTEMLKNVVAMSGQLNRKLKRTEECGIPTNCDKSPEKGPNPPLDLVGLFNNIADQLYDQINILGNNIDQSINTIE
jgi:hypothetical protein